MYISRGEKNKEEVEENIDFEIFEKKIPKMIILKKAVKVLL